MSTIKLILFVILTFQNWMYVAQTAVPRNHKLHKLKLLGNILNTHNLPLKNVQDSMKIATLGNGKLSLKYPVHLFNKTLDTLESLKGQLALDRQLQKVDVYCAVDYSNDPVVSYYPKDTREKKFEPPTEKYKVKKPNYYTLVQEFLHLFTQDPEGKNSVSYDLKSLNSELANAVLVFMDPNSCADHVLGLNKEEKEAKMHKFKLNRVFKMFRKKLNFYRDKDTVNVLLPLSESLVYATNQGGTYFKGTPLFTTDPPMYVSNENKTGSLKDVSKKVEEDFTKFNKNYKLLVFFTPSEAKEFYKKVRWSKSYKDEKTGKVYRVWSKSPPFRPDVKVTSLEKVYKKVHSSEPFWGYSLEFVPPTLSMDKRTVLMLNDSTNWLLVPWYTLKKLVMTVMN